MRENEEAAGANGGQDDAEGGELPCNVQDTEPEPWAASPICRLCGLAVGERDYAAVYPFDSECACGSPWPEPVIEELPAPNETWFREHTELLGLDRAPTPAQSRPKLRPVPRSAPPKPAMKPERPAWVGFGMESSIG